MNNFKSLADFASAVLGLSTLVVPSLGECAIAYAAIAATIKRNGGGK